MEFPRDKCGSLILAITESRSVPQEQPMLLSVFVLSVDAGSERVAVML